jgi:hypothetical protein
MVITDPIVVPLPEATVITDLIALRSGHDHDLSIK